MNPTQIAKKDNPLRITQIVSLHELADQLIKGLLPSAVSNKSLIINEIDPSLMVQTDENMLAYVLWNLLNRVILSTREASIHIEAVHTGEQTVIRVKDAGTYFYRSLNNGFRQVQQAAEKLGGIISIDETRDQGTCVAISLYNDLKPDDLKVA